MLVFSGVIDGCPFTSEFALPGFLSHAGHARMGELRGVLFGQGLRS